MWIYPLHDCDINSKGTKFWSIQVNYSCGTESLKLIFFQKKKKEINKESFNSIGKCYICLLVEERKKSAK